jgi:hypothetical protein
LSQKQAAARPFPDSFVEKIVESIGKSAGAAACQLSHVPGFGAKNKNMPFIFSG